MHIQYEATMGFLVIPIENQTTGNIRKEDQDEIYNRLYVYWLPTNQLAISLDYRYEYYTQDPGNNASILLRELSAHYVPLGVSYFHPSGFFAKVRGQYIYQEIEQFVTGSTTIEEKGDNFILFDAAIGYRLPRRIK